MAGPNQCKHEVRIGATDLVYLCCHQIGHDGPHHIAISAEFCLCDPANDKTGLFGVCRRAAEQEKK